MFVSTSARRGSDTRFGELKDGGNDTCKAAHQSNTHPNWLKVVKNTQAAKYAYTIFAEGREAPGARSTGGSRRRQACHMEIPPSKICTSPPASETEKERRTSAAPAYALYPRAAPLVCAPRGRFSIEGGTNPTGTRSPGIRGERHFQLTVSMICKPQPARKREQERRTDAAPAYSLYPRAVSPYCAPGADLGVKM